MIYNRQEAMRYMGAAAKDAGAEQLCDVVYLKLRNEVQARSLIRRVDCNVSADAVEVAGVKFQSKSLAKHLQGLRYYLDDTCLVAILFRQVVLKVFLLSVYYPNLLLLLR